MRKKQQRRDKILMWIIAILLAIIIGMAMAIAKIEHEKNHDVILAKAESQTVPLPTLPALPKLAKPTSTPKNFYHYKVIRRKKIIGEHSITNQGSSYNRNINMATATRIINTQNNEKGIGYIKIIQLM